MVRRRTIRKKPIRAKRPAFFVNPEIVWASEETRNYQEGLPVCTRFYDDVARPAQCRVAFLDYDGKAQELACDGLLATCIQHEMDHLEGIVFLDRLSRLKRQMVLKKSPKPSAIRRGPNRVGYARRFYGDTGIFGSGVARHS